jgi:hypothetical protein
MALAQSAGGTSREALLAGALRLKKELDHAGRMLNQAARVCAAWDRVFRALRCGYTRTGQPEKLRYLRQFAIRG